MSLAPLDLLIFTYRSLSGNLLRSALTTVGVFMGVTAVSATLQVGTISRAVIAQRLAEREAPQVTLIPQWVPGPDRRIQLKLEDLEFLRQRLTGLQSISAWNWMSAGQTVFQDQQTYPSMIAVSQEYLLTSGQQLAAGRFFTAADFADFRPVAVIDQLLVAQLFQNQYPIGKQIYAARQPYTVVGVVPTKTQDEEDPTEGLIMIPIAYYSALTGSREIDSIRIRPRELKDLEDLGDRAEQLLTQRFPSQQFWVWNNVEDILEQQRILALTSQALAAVGAISLLVGGVGIANIMIASVTERTAEIGLRRAIGATQTEIMLQFILEATLLSLLGGSIAIATVHGLTVVVTDQFELPYEFAASSASLTLGSALLVGVGASLLPALRASQLDPVKALRSE
jgi:putative ABC transport system permease protein